MDWFKRNIESWDKVADQYEQRFMSPGLFEPSYLYLVDNLPYRAKILEIGSGPGNISHYLNSKRPDLHFTLTDASEAMLNIAKRHLPFADVIHLNTSELGVIDSTFDCIVCGFVVPYLDLVQLDLLFKKIEALKHQNTLVYLSFIEGINEEKITERRDLSMKQFLYSLETISELVNSFGWVTRKEFRTSMVNNDLLESYIILILDQTK